MSEGAPQAHLFPANGAKLELANELAVVVATGLASSKDAY